MPIEITIPKFGLTMTEAQIVEWKVKEGDLVEKGDVIFVLETEKVTYEVEAPEAGKIGKILVPLNETVPVGTIVAYLLKEGESLPESIPEEIDTKPAQAAEKAAEPSPSSDPASAESRPSTKGGRIIASPAAKKLAGQLGVELEKVSGSGPRGRIVEADVRAAAEASPAGSEDTGEEGIPPHRIIPLTGMRRAIAAKMLESKTTTAQTYMTRAVDAGQIMAYRKKVLNRIQQTQGVRVTITDLLMCITGAALEKHPMLNSRWTDQGIMEFEKVNMGMAMALDEGLIVPVIRGITAKNPAEVAVKRQELVELGKNRKFSQDDISGSTFTLSTLGMFGVDQFTANINMPETGILAVGAVVDKPVAIEGQVVIRPMINITLSYDHRVIDGADAARFMKTLKTYIEDPGSVLEVPSSEGTPKKKRVTVIGGGVGGYSAAIFASRRGAEVTLVEKGDIGGVCLNRGCIPTKSMLHSGEVLKNMKKSEVFGISCDNINFDFKKIMDRKNYVVDQLRNGVEKLLAAGKIRVVRAAADLKDPSKVEIPETGEEIAFDDLIIATGSTPRPLDVEGADSPNVLNSNDFLSMENVPASIAIVGGGYIGVEFAQILRRLNAEVTILEFMDTIVPGVDNEIAEALQKALEEEGIQIYTGAKVESIKDGGKECTVQFSCGDRQETCVVDKVLSAVGRKPDLSWFDPDKLGIAQVKESLYVNDRMETSVPNIYAVGDATGGIMLAHMAMAEAECAAKNIMGQPDLIDRRAVPSCIYTAPEVAAVGITEEAARQRGKVRVGRFPFQACGKALVINEPYGMVKIVADDSSGTVLGVHIIGPNATDMIAEAVLGISLNMTVEDLAHSIHPHPSLSEAVMESALTLCDGAIHIP